jgi:hypothetical protein
MTWKIKVCYAVQEPIEPGIFRKWQSFFNMTVAPETPNCGVSRAEKTGCSPCSTEARAVDTSRILDDQNGYRLAGLSSEAWPRYSGQRYEVVAELGKQRQATRWRYYRATS